MAFVFHRRLAIPLWAMAFLAVALTARPPAAPFLMAVLGVAVIALTIAGLVPWLRTSRSAVNRISHRQRNKRSAAIAVDRGTYVRTLEEADVNTAQDALDLVRMDDDGGWQMARPPASRSAADGTVHDVQSNPNHRSPEVLPSNG
jgi:hypothetical protein